MDLFDLAAKLTLDSSEYEKGINGAKSSASGLAKNLGGALKTISKISIAAVGAAGTAVGKIVYDSVKAYSEYEQMVGGVKKLYGTAGMNINEYAKSVGKSVDSVKTDFNRLKEAENIVMKNAAQAYETAGMSANEYMDTATSFSASLINSLGGDSVKAAKLTDVAMRSISDNFNTFGGDLQNIRNAYQGFAKQNYTLLDNLKLGYGGTKTEMERLIADAASYTDIQKDLNLTVEKGSLDFANIVKAIEVMQKKQGIAGTTAREAFSTIQGSINMTKAAWQNFIVGLSDSESDLEQLSNNLLKSAKYAFNNIVKTGKVAVKNLSSAVKTNIKPMLNDLLDMVIDTLPDVVEAAFGLIDSFASAIVSNSSRVGDAVEKIFGIFAEKIKNPQSIVNFIDAASNIIGVLIDSISDQKNAEDITRGAVLILDAIVRALVDNSIKLAGAVPAILTGILNGILNPSGDPSTGSIGEQIIGGIASKFSPDSADINAIGENFLGGIENGIVVNIPEFIGRVSGEIIGGFTGVATNFFMSFGNVLVGLAEGIESGDWSKLADVLLPAAEIGSAFEEGLEKGFANAGGFAADVVEQDTEQAKKAIGAMFEFVTTKSNETVDAVKDLPESTSPFMNDITKQFTESAKDSGDAFKTVPGVVKGYFSQIESDATTSSVDAVNNYISGARSRFDALKSTFSEMAGIIHSFVGFSEPEKGPLSDFHTYAPDMIKLFVKGVKDNEKMLQDTVAEAFDFMDETSDFSSGDYLSPNLTDITTEEITYSKDESESGSMAQALEAVRTYLPLLSEKQVYLDSGVLAGSLVAPIDKQLGRRAQFAARGGV